jgi:hypothetical protein
MCFTKESLRNSSLFDLSLSSCNCKISFSKLLQQGFLVLYAKQREHSKHLINSDYCFHSHHYIYDSTAKLSIIAGGFADKIYFS